MFLCKWNWRASSHHPPFEKAWNQRSNVHTFFECLCKHFVNIECSSKNGHHITSHGNSTSIILFPLNHATSSTFHQITLWLGCSCEHSHFIKCLLNVYEGIPCFCKQSDGHECLRKNGQCSSQFMSILRHSLSIAQRSLEGWTKSLVRSG